MIRHAPQGRHWGRVARLLVVDVVPISMGKNVPEQYVARRAARQVMVLGAELVVLIVVVVPKKTTCVCIPAATADLASTRIKMDTMEDALLVRLACTALPVHRFAI